MKRLWGYTRAFGPLRGPYLLGRLWRAKHGLIEVSVPALGAPMILRARSSDKPAFEQVFVVQAYDTSFIGFRPETIIDGGANSGFTTRFFANRYPWARIFAIEPEASNFELLVRNTRHLNSVVPIRAALWNRPTALKIPNPLDEKWAFRVQQGTGGDASDIRAVTVSELIARAGSTRVDILKLDIEGAEQDLFESDYDSWLGRVNAIVIELHESLRPGCTEVFYRAIRPYRFRLFHRGEHAILVRQPPIT